MATLNLLNLCQTVIINGGLLVLFLNKKIHKAELFHLHTVCLSFKIIFRLVGTFASTVYQILTHLLNNDKATIEIRLPYYVIGH
jgi:hypothetical protein